MTGAVLGFLGVALGAFGAHALSGRIDASTLETFDTAVRYQVLHALALLAFSGLLFGAGIGSDGRPGEVNATAISSARWARWLWVGGVLVFSGSLYLFVATGAGWWGAVTPLGGLGLLGGWVAAGLTAARA